MTLIPFLSFFLNNGQHEGTNFVGKKIGGQKLHQK